MTISQLIQLYAPLAGLLAMAFWVGGLSARVRQLERDAQTHDGFIEKLAKLETNSINTIDRLTSIERGMDGVQRQLGNLMMRPAREIGG